MHEEEAEHASPPQRCLRQPHAPSAHSQVRASDHPNAARLPSLGRDAPAALQQLVWECTAHARRQRPTAHDVVRRLEGLLNAL